MEAQFLESGWASVSKHDEKLCGDFFKTFENRGRQVFVLSDGLGSGVKANILSTLTATILGTMLSRGIPLDECIATVATTLPVCRTRKLAYSTFTVLQIERGTAYLAQYCNPPAILLRQGRNLDYAHDVHFIGEKEILESHVQLATGDILVVMSDGVAHPGGGQFAAERLAAGGTGRLSGASGYGRSVGGTHCGADHRLLPDSQRGVPG
jgi:serine phosphatase RsbU (regulator of sigma subunit)